MPAIKITILRQERGLNIGNAPLTFEDEQRVHTPYNVASAEVRYYSNGRSFWNYMIGADLIRQTNPVNVRAAERFVYFGRCFIAYVHFPVRWALYPDTGRLFRSLSPISRRTIRFSEARRSS